MPLEPGDAASLWDMFTAAKGLVASLKDVGLKEYRANGELRLTVERRIEIIGEAARRLSASFKSAHQEIPWRRIIAQRNVLIHDYDEIDHERIWRLAVEEIPRLLEQLGPLLPPLPQETKEYPD